jgi:hypothetical protein
MLFKVYNSIIIIVSHFKETSKNTVANIKKHNYLQFQVQKYFPC